MAGAMVLVVAGMLTGCTDYGKITDKALTLGDYSAIDVSNGVDVEMMEGISTPVLTADELIMDKVRAEVKDGTLFLELKDMVYTTRIKELKVKLPVNANLRRITASGASYVRVQGEVPLNELTLSGATSADINHTTDMKKIVMSGLSHAEIKGTGDVVEIVISGGSDLEADKLLVSEIKGVLSGASSVDVTVCTRLAIVASGASSINFGLVSPTCEVQNDCELTGGSVISQR